MWIEDMLCSRLLREHEASYHALAKRVREAGELRPYYFYVSIYRPLWTGWAAGLPDPIYVHNTPRTSFVGTRTPIPIDRLKKLELVPWNAHTKAQVAIEFAASQGEPIELSSNDDESTIVLFLNPRRRWQLSYFAPDVGPTGHVEGDDPVELLGDEIGRHCRWTPGRVDAIVASLDLSGHPY